MRMRRVGAGPCVGEWRWVRVREEQRGPEVFWVDFLERLTRSRTHGGERSALIPLSNVQGGEKKR